MFSPRGWIPFKEMELEKTYYSGNLSPMPDADHYTNTLGIEWNSQTRLKHQKRFKNTQKTTKNG